MTARMTARTTGSRTTAVLVALAVLAAGAAQAHELRPALLSLTETGVTETGEHAYDVLWRVPIEAAMTDVPVPVFPDAARRLAGEVRLREGDFVVQRFRLTIPGGLAGQSLRVRFQSGRGSEVLVRIANRNGSTVTGRIVPGRQGASPDAAGEVFVVPTAPTALAVAATYLKLGVEHILTGFDHLAFVLGLLLLTPAWRKLWKTVTAFTVAHSLTLALATLGLVRLPPAPVEATIALSIVFVAREVFRQRSGAIASAPRTPPSALAFVFGLLHGLGFAGALSQVGLPDTDIPLALLAFNLGVEAGQLLFVAAVLLLRSALRPLLARLPPGGQAQLWLRLAPAYAIGSMAAFWCLAADVAGFWNQ